MTCNRELDFFPLTIFLTNFGDMLNSADMINFLEIQIKLFLTSFEVVFNLFNQIYVVFELISVG